MNIPATLIPGDGIGPEITAETVRVLKAAAAPMEWEEQPLNEEILSQTWRESGSPLPQRVMDSMRRTRLALKGPLTTPIGKGYPSLNLTLRKVFDLYANLRPARSLPNVKSRFDAVNLIVVRENTEGEYSGLEHEVVPGVVESLKIITRVASERIALFAFEFARREKREKVTAVHKANIMKKSDGLFLECCRSTALRFPDITYEEMIVDNTCMQLVLNPSRLDVMVLPNLYGDIVSDLCAGLIGGLGVTPSGNIGRDCAMFEAVHGSAKDIAGKNIANPTALLLSAVMMLRHVQQADCANRIETAIHKTLTDGQKRTRDLGGNSSTTEYADAIISNL